MFLAAATITTPAVFIRFFFEEKFSDQKNKRNYKDDKGYYFLNHDDVILGFEKQSKQRHKPIYS